VLYYLLTGRPVYPGGWGFAAFQQASQGEQVPPHQINPRVPRGLERICLKALAPDPERRYRTAGDLERALRGFLRRRWVVAAILVGLALPVVAFFVSRLQPERPGSAGTHPAGFPAVTGPSPPVAAPKIVMFDVKHIRGNNPPRSFGSIRGSPEPILFGDDVRVEVRLNGPAYGYLIALNPDGKPQLCHPSEVTEAPPQADEVDYPLDTKWFPLTDGKGLQAFIFLASRGPLPRYDQWEGRNGLRWESIPVAGAGRWEFNGRTFDPLTSGPRAEPRERSGVPRAFKEVCTNLAKLPEIDAVRAIVFPVAEPK
jgi:hypothetical protein